MPRNPCTNCDTHIEPKLGRKEGENEWVHRHTLEVECRPYDLANAGMSEAMVGEQIDGIAHYSACPVPVNDDGPYSIDKSDWHAILHHEYGLVMRVYPHGSGSFMGSDDAASLLAIKVCNWLNSGGADA